MRFGGAEQAGISGRKMVAVLAGIRRVWGRWLGETMSVNNQLRRVVGEGLGTLQCVSMCSHASATKANQATKKLPSCQEARNALCVPLPACSRVAAALECGIVWVNCSQPCFCQAPWGGIKNSGFGRELGPFGLENFLSVKQVGGAVEGARN